MGELEDPLGINGDVHHSLELRAVVQLARGEIEAALRLVQVAVAHSASNHPGWFVSPTIERMLLHVGSLDVLDVVDSTGRPVSADTDGPVAHVLAGSATELMEREGSWWEADANARLVPLPDTEVDLLESAARLRGELDGSSLVVIHGAGSAVAPVLALAGWRQRPPVVIVEADRTAFWLGLGIADIVIHASHASMALAVERRCLARERGVLVERHERRDPEVLRELLQRCADRARSLGRPLVPNALLPAPPNSMDRWTVAQQREHGIADGLRGALARWPLPVQLRAQLGWVLLASDATLVTSTLHTLLDVLPDEFPDIVVINVTADPEVDALAADLAGVAQVISPGRAITDDVGAEMARRLLVMEEVLVVSDGLAPVGVPVDEFDLRRFSSGVLHHMRARLADGAAAVVLDGLPGGETLELVAQWRSADAGAVLIDLEGRARGEVTASGGSSSESLPTGALTT